MAEKRYIIVDHNNIVNTWTTQDIEGIVFPTGFRAIEVNTFPSNIARGGTYENSTFTPKDVTATAAQVSANFKTRVWRACAQGYLANKQQWVSFAGNSDAHDAVNLWIFHGGALMDRIIDNGISGKTFTTAEKEAHVKRWEDTMADGDSDGVNVEFWYNVVLSSTASAWAGVSIRAGATIYFDGINTTNYNIKSYDGQFTIITGVTIPTNFTTETSTLRTS